MPQPVREIEGELTAVPLAELVPVLGERGASGTLVIERGLKQRTFTLREGAIVREASNDPREYLGQFLVDVGMVSSEAAARLYFEQERTRVPLAELLARHGLVEPERLREGLRLKFRESLLGAYRWLHGRVHFTPDEPRPIEGLEVEVRLMDVHREANGRAREWEAIAAALPSLDVVLRPADAIEPGGRLQPEEELLLEMAREGCTVGEALDAFRDGEFHAYRRLMGMLRRELLVAERLDPAALPKRRSPAEQLEEARRLHAAGRLDEALEAVGIAVDRGAEGALQLLRTVQTEVALTLADRLLTLEGVPFVRPRERELARLDLSPAELYLTRRISLTRSLREAIRRAPMGELRALKIVDRLVAVGVIGFVARRSAEQRSSA